MNMTDKQRAQIIRAHRTTEATALEYARAARKAGEIDKAEAFKRMAEHAHRRALQAHG